MIPPWMHAWKNITMNLKQFDGLLVTENNLEDLRVAVQLETGLLDVHIIPYGRFVTRDYVITRVRVHLDKKSQVVLVGIG